MREEQDERLLADYDITFSAEKSQAAKRIEEAGFFLNRIKKFFQEEDKK
ncbi:MAG: hypothetical protein ACLFRY_07085 [Spirochaetia bacterium]